MRGREQAQRAAARGARLSALLLAATVASCTGTIDDGPSIGRGPSRGAIGDNSPGGGRGNDPTGSGGAGTGSSGVTPTPPGTGQMTDLPDSPDELAQVPLADVAASVTPSPETRAARLTHVQWANSVRDLLRLPPNTPLPELRPDPVSAGFTFYNSGATLEVDVFLRDGYQQAAEDLAALVTSDAASLDKILPDGSRTAMTGPETFIRGFGLRAHRRPLTDDEVAAYRALYTTGAGHYRALPAFEAGVRVLLEAFLQSPHFLYRWEPSETETGGVIPLDGYEVASRLSYTLWDTMPDDELLDLAGTSDLTSPERVAMEVQRMLDDPRAEPVVESYHAQLMTASKFERIAPSRTFFPNAPNDLGELAGRELSMFVREVAFAQEGGYRDLLTSTETFVNDDLARVYGVSGTFGDAFVKVQLDDSQRKGVFTQIGFLAAHSTSANPDPIKRGVFMAERVACLHISSPNDASPPPQPSPGSTNRELIESHTEQPTTPCAGCHTPLINPFGFPFENYDAIGGYRTTDNGHPVNASASPLIAGRPTAVENALELIDALVESSEVHTCYATHWVEFLFGRHKTQHDAPLATRIGFASRDEDLSIKRLVQTLASSRAFLNRSTEEVP
jgi:hypothetical protein